MSKQEKRNKKIREARTYLFWIGVALGLALAVFQCIRYVIPPVSFSLWLFLGYFLTFICYTALKTMMEWMEIEYGRPRLGEIFVCIWAFAFLGMLILEKVIEVASAYFDPNIYLNSDVIRETLIIFSAVIVVYAMSIVSKMLLNNKKKIDKN